MIPIIIKNARLLIRNSILHHLLFWAVTYFVLVNLFSNTSQINPVDRIYTLIFMVTLAFAVYLNLFFLIPKFLRPRKYLAYSTLLLIALLAGVFFNWLLFSYIIDYVLPGYYFISYFTFFDLAKFFVVLLATSTLFKLSKEWFQLVESKQQLAEIEKEKVEIELKALRSQVNPHFLFNSLNVLYTLALKKTEQTPEVIIKLSDLLRYVIYDSNKEKVKLGDEIEQILNYLDLQSYRMETTSDVTFDKDVRGDILIPPMLLIPLVENSFKHGIKGDLADTYIHIQLKANDKKVIFHIENNRSINDPQEENSDHGIGLTNIRNRLALIYPEQYLFKISENDHTFSVRLEICHED